MRFDRSTLNGAVFSDCSERIVDHFGESMSSGRISPGSRRYVSRWVMDVVVYLRRFRYFVWRCFNPDI